MRYLQTGQLKQLLLLGGLIFILLFVGCRKDMETNNGMTHHTKISFELEMINFIKSASDIKDPQKGFLSRIGQVPVTQRQSVTFNFKPNGGFTGEIKMLEPTRQDIVALHEPLPNDFPQPDLIKIDENHLVIYDQFGELIADVPINESALQHLLPALDFENTGERLSNLPLGDIITGSIDYTEFIKELQKKGATVETLDNGLTKVKYSIYQPGLTNDLSKNPDSLNVISFIDQTHNVLILNNLYDQNDSLVMLNAFKYELNATGQPELDAVHQEVHERSPSGISNKLTVNEYDIDNLSITTN